MTTVSPSTKEWQIVEVLKEHGDWMLARWQRQGVDRFKASTNRAVSLLAWVCSRRTDTTGDRLQIYALISENVGWLLNLK